MGAACIRNMSYSDFSKQIHENAVLNRIPINGVLELTQRCNLSCRHCYCVPDRIKEDMDFKQICAVLDELNDAGCLWLLITGGEPLLRHDFLDIYMYAKQKGFIISVFTNGTLISNEIVNCFKKYPPFVIEISLYGAIAQTYEKVTGVEGSFKRCMHGINMLHNTQIPFKLKTTITKDNVSELKHMKSFAKRLGVEFRFDAMLHPRLDGSKENLQCRLSPEEAIKIEQADEKVSNAWVELWHRQEKEGKSDKVFYCGAGVSSVHIDPYGILRICDMIRTPAYELGKENSFDQAWKEIAKMFSLKHSSDHKCTKCEIANLCDQCPGWSQLEYDDNATPSDYLCEMAKSRAERMGILKEEIGGMV